MGKIGRMISEILGFRYFVTHTPNNWGEVAKRYQKQIKKYEGKPRKKLKKRS